MLRVDVARLKPEGYAHVGAFDEVASTIIWGLEQLGYQVETPFNQIHPGVPTILFGANLLTPEQIISLPDSVIIYNLEQVALDSPWFSQERFTAFTQRKIFWEYSQRNLDEWTRCGVSQGVYVPIGYAPILSQIERTTPCCDVVFYGSINPRRQAILDALRHEGLEVEAVFGVYGRARDQAIARAKIALNIHYYATSILEMVRISYLLANRIPVVSERDDKTEVDPDFENAIVFSTYDHLVESCLAIVHDSKTLTDVAERGFSIMQEHAIEPILRQALLASGL